MIALNAIRIVIGRAASTAPGNAKHRLITAIICEIGANRAVAEDNIFPLIASLEI